MTDILSRIDLYRRERGWTEQQLAQRAGVPRSTIFSWYRENAVPTIASLEKVCAAFGISLSQLFAQEDAPVALTADQRDLLERWAGLTLEQRSALLALIETMHR